jgi:DNA-directed RNA polymerase III subunit RPC6
MLFDVQPSKDVTGGAWYTDQELDQEYVDEITGFVVSWIRRKVTLLFVASVRRAAKISHWITITQTLGTSRAAKLAMSTVVSVSDVQQALAQSNISSTVLTHSDIHSLLRMCIYDGTLEMYRAGYRAIPTAGSDANESQLEEVTQSPCGICPVAKFCAPDSVISPQNCEYYASWLSGETSFCGSAGADKTE